MAQVKISELTAADALDGTEEIPGVQGGVTKGITSQQIADFAGGGAETFLELTDTPAGYGSSANFVVRVNGAETALEFVDLDTLYAQLGSANVFTDVQTIESAAPEIVFSETDTTDQNWRLAAGGGVYSIQDINDSFVFIRNNISLTHGGGMQVGSPTGGDQGAGTVNAEGLFENGTGVAKLSGGADANFTTAPQVGGAGVLVENTSGVVIQQAFSSTGAVVSTTTIIPYDDTIPQDTEGAEALAISFTPKRADSRLRISANLQVRSDTAVRVVIATLFSSSSSDALAAACELGDDGTLPIATSITVVADIASPGVSEHTFSARFGIHSTGTAYLNANNSGIRRFGGVFASTLEIMEYMP